MLRMLEGYRTVLRQKLMASDTAIVIPRADAIRLNVIGIGNYTYLTVKDSVNIEIIKYSHTANWQNDCSASVSVSIERNITGLGAKNFPYGACIVSELNSVAVVDLINEYTTIVNCQKTVAVSEVPSTTEGDLPEVVLGQRGSLLGTPNEFLELCDGKLIPVYSRSE